MTLDAHGKSSSRHLVVFGCGYVGAAVAEEALTRGWQVTALTRNPAKAAELARRGMAAVVADLAEPNWHEQVPPADHVLNAVSASTPDLAGYRRSYVQGMRSVLSWLRGTGQPATVVYTSSTAVYPQDGGMAVNEDVSLEGGGDRAALLHEAERLLMAGTDAQARWFVLRLAGIYGPGRRHLIDQVRSGEVSGTPDTHLNLAHRNDIVAAIWACFDARAAVRNEIFNVTDDGRATKREVVDWLAARLGLPALVYTGRPAGGRRANTPDRIILNDKLKRILGWTPRFPTFREGYAPLLETNAAEK